MPKKRRPTRRPAGRPVTRASARSAPRRSTAAAPRRPPERVLTPNGSALRRRIERASARPLLRLTRLPRWLTPLLLGLLTVVALALPGWRGALALLPILVFLSWLSFLAWPTAAGRQRLLRGSALALIVGYGAWTLVRG